MRTVWFNDNAIPESDAKLSIYDSALMFGDMVFEMTRTFNRKIFKLREHMNRLKRSCEYLQIDVPYKWDYLEFEYERLIEVNKDEWKDDDEIRGLINISRGILPMYADAGMGMEGTNIIMACFPLRNVLHNKSHIYLKGVSAEIPRQLAIPEYLLDAKIKSRSRQHYKMADLQFKDRESMALLFDPDGFATEGTGSNFFTVKDGVVYTPEPRNCLRGISRDYIKELCAIKCIDCVEKNLTFYDIINADEAFFTNTPYCIIPIRSIEGYDLDCVGKVTEYLMNTWIKRQNCDFIQQARKWDNDTVD